MAEPTYELFDGDPNNGGTKVAEVRYDLTNNVVIIRHESAAAEAKLDGDGLDVPGLITGAISGAVTSAEITDLEGNALAVASGALGVEAGTITESELDAIDSPSDGDVLVWNQSQGRFEWFQDGFTPEPGQVWADDGNIYSSVQSAVDNATSWVMVGPGTFQENVSITTQGLTISGFGRGTLIDGQGSPAIVYNATQDAQLEIRDMAVRTNAASTADAISPDGVKQDDVTVRNVTVEEAGGNGIAVDGVEILVTECQIESAGAAGIISLGNDNKVVISENRVEGTGGVGIKANGSAGPTVANNLIITPTGAGVEITGNFGTVGFNTIRGGSAEGILVNAAQNTIVSNTIDTPSGHGIVANETAYITSNMIEDAGDRGISIHDFLVNVVGNTIEGSTNEAIYDDVGFNQYVGNFINNTSNGAPGINCQSRDNVASSNTIFNTSGPGILIAGGSSSGQCVVTCNMIQDTESYGIHSQGFETIICGNRIYDTQDIGIEATNRRQIIIANSLENIGGIGIRGPDHNTLVISNVIRRTKSISDAGIACGGSRINIADNQIIDADTGIDLNGFEQKVADNMIEGATTGIDTAGASSQTVVDNVVS